MHSLRTKIVMMAVFMIVAVVLVITVTSVLFIRNTEHRKSDQLLLLLCETGERNLNYYFTSVEKSVKKMASYTEKDLDGLEDDKLAAHTKRVESYFEEIANKTNGVLTYYYRIDPSVSSKVKGFWYTNLDGTDFVEHEVTDISTALDRLTELILLLFAGAFVIVLIVLKCFYTWKQTCKIASVPLLSVLTIVSVFAAAGKTLDFFAIIGMVLVFGLGLDYIIYMMEHKKENALQLEPFAIVLSFLTTALSFGTLAMSTFMPVHLLGLSIFSGLATAFICTLF